MDLEIFKKKKYASLILRNSSNDSNDNSLFSPVIPDGSWIKCPNCTKTVYAKEIGDLKICPKCGGYFRLGAWERIDLIADVGSFVELFSNLKSTNPISYPGYDEKLSDLQVKTGLVDAIVCGHCKICGEFSFLCVMDSNFLMGSMGSVVGERLTRTIELATSKKKPVVVFTASGGARMHEGILSLMQMAKISAALSRHSAEGLFFMPVLTDPTTGGVTASFAMQGDIIAAEPNAIIGFAGKRVIEQTIRQKLPHGFQRSEFLLEHGFIDIILERMSMREALGNILKLHNYKD